MAVVTQGPPLWLGTSSWQLDLRAFLEGRFGPVADSCGSDEEALENRAAAFRDRGWRTDVLRRHAVHPVDPSWIIGHLGSALPADAVDADLIHDLGAHLGPGPGDRVEQVETTVLLARPS